MRGTASIAWFSKAAGLFRPLFLPLGLVALVLVGIHRGADRIDDVLLTALDAADAIADRGLATLLAALGGVVGASPETIDRLALQGAELFSLESRETVARILALVAEAVAGFLLAAPLIGYRETLAVDSKLRGAARDKVQRELRGRGLGELARAAARVVMDPTLLKLSLPLATAAAGIAGAFVVGRELEAQLFGLLVRAGPAGDVAAKFVGAGAALVVVVALLGRATLRALERADQVAREDRLERTPAVRRRLRGMLVAVVALPVGLSGLVAATPLGSLLAPAAGSGPALEAPPVAPPATTAAPGAPGAPARASPRAGPATTAAPAPPSPAPEAP